ncbi:MAG: cytochrome c [Gemmatimonadales bacterium]
MRDTLSGLAIAAVLGAAAGCGSSRATATDAGSMPTAEVAPAATSLPDGVDDQMVARGRSVYSNGACARCHGPGGGGGQLGPSLVRGGWLQIGGSYEEIVRVVTTGVPESRIRNRSYRLAMHPRGGAMNLSDPDIRAVSAYVWTISRKK